MSNRLLHLEDTARSSHTSVSTHAKAASEKALQAGAALIEAKSLLKHGQWSNWLAQTGIPERSAQRYMAIAKGGLNSAIVADMGLAEAARLAGLGHRLWPTDDRIRHAEGIDDQHVAEAIWSRQADGSIRYSARHRIGSAPALFVQYPPVAQPWLLGLFHDRFPDIFGQIYCLSPEDAEVVVNRIEARR